MRIFKYLGILAITLLISCTGNKPEATVTEFFKAISAKDFGKAKLLSTEKSHSTISMLENGLDINLGSGKLKNVDCVPEGETNLCDCFFEGSSQPFPVTLVKENDAWKVDVQSTAKNMMDGVLDKLKGIDINGLMEKFGGEVDLSSDKINDFIKNLDADKITETLKGLDSNMGETETNIEDLVNQITKGMGKSE